MTIIVIFGLIAVVFLYFYVRKHYKMPKTDNMICVTGGVKSGKSTFSYALAESIYRRNLRAYKVRKFFRKLINQFRRNKLEEEEKPLFYSTIPINREHVLLDLPMLKRDVRFAFKSVIWVDEASLLADSQSYKDLDLNDRLLLFNKLIAHETHGGTIVYNTQSIGDLHYSVKRCLAETFYVHHTAKWLPFFLVVTVREERYSEDGLAVNTYGEDVEESLKRVIIRKSVWKKFDCYAYSSMTDSLPPATDINKIDSLKATKIVSFNDRHNITIKENDNEKKNN